MKNLIVFSAGRSPGLRQYVDGISDLVSFFGDISPGSINVVLVKSATQLLRLQHLRNSVLLLFSHSPRTLIIAIIASFLGAEVSFYIHEPFPLSFAFAAKHRVDNKRLLRMALTSFIFNPLILLISSSLVVASQTASFIVNTGFMGAILYFSKKKLIEIPLPYPLALLSYRSKGKIQRICITGSLNEDKGLTDFLHAASINPKLNFAILVSA